MPPNVILLVLDTARADAFEPYGAASGASPAIADLGGDGVVAERMHAAASWTLPSHAAMFTGSLPRDAGLGQAPGGMPQGARPVIEAQAERFLPAVLRRNGFETRAVSTNLWLTPQSGFATGFDEFVSLDTRRQSQLSHTGLRSRVRWLVEGARARADDGAAEAEGVLARWIDEKPTQPFFWFVNLVECHSPYLPPRPYNDLGVIDRMRAADEASSHLSLSEIWKACAGGYDVPPDALERMRHLYSRAVRALDDWVGRLAERLESAGLLDDTFLIITSDHGENFGESGYMGHAFSLDQRLLHVPFVVRGPGAAEAQTATSLLDLPRLIARAVGGLADDPYGPSRLPGGVGVAQFDPPTGPEDPRVDQALAEWGLGDEARPRITTPLTAATDGSIKLLRRGDAEELYDLEDDPLEERPLSAGHVPDALREAIITAMAAPTPAATADAEEISDEERRQLEERMRLLGYM